MNAIADHPTKAELSAFALGKLPDDSSTAIEDHLSACQSCSATLASVADDTLIGLLAEHDDADIHEAGWIDVRLDDPEQTTAHAQGKDVEIPAELAGHPRYRVVRLLGRGGMGDVYLAEHRLMERLVAVKVMKRTLMGRAEAVERFRREVKTAAQLKHENIVTAYDAEQAGDLHLLVMEYVEGRDLATEVKQRGPLPIHEACEYARQAALGLAHAHERSMVHRDVKPQNLMRMRSAECGMRDEETTFFHSDSRAPNSETIKILDFGLAQVAAVAADSTVKCDGASPSITSRHSVLGTPDYIAPEQVQDGRRADHRSDIYSLGATLYFLLAGRPPFAEGSATERIEAHLRTEPVDIRKLRPEIPEELADLIGRMMAKSPEVRPQSAAKLAGELGHGFERATNPTELPPIPTNRGRFFIAAILLLLLVGAGSWGLAQIIITIRDRAGNQARLEVPDGARVNIDEAGNAEVNVGGGMSLSNAPNGSAPMHIDRPTGVEYFLLRTRDGFYLHAVQGGGDDIRADVTTPATSGIFTFEWLDREKSRVRLRTRDGYYLHPARGGGDDIDAKETEPGSSEVFTVEWVNRDARTLRLITREGHYLNPVGGGGGNVNAAVKEPGSSEVFTLMPANMERFALRTREGFYLRAVNGGGDDVRADSSHPTSTDIFTLHRFLPIQNGEEKVGLSTRDVYLVRAVDGGGHGVDAGVKPPSVGPLHFENELFTIEWVDRDAGKLRLKTRRNYYVHPVLGGGGGVDAVVKEPGTSEVFTLVPVDEIATL